MNSGQIVHAFEVIDDIVVILGGTDFRDSKEPDEFILGQQLRTRAKAAVSIRQNDRDYCIGCG